MSISHKRENSQAKKGESQEGNTNSSCSKFPLEEAGKWKEFLKLNNLCGFPEYFSNTRY